MMETNTKILLISAFLLVLALIILIFVLIKIREDNAPKFTKQTKMADVNIQNLFQSIRKTMKNNNLNSYNKGLEMTYIPDENFNPDNNENKKLKKDRNILEIIAIDLYDFLKNSITVIFDNVYKKLFNTKLQGYIRYEDNSLKFSRDKNGFCKVLLNSDGQILIGRNLDRCLERKFIDSYGNSAVIASMVSPITQSKKWKLKNGSILDYTGNFCLGIIGDDVRILSVSYLTENKELIEQIDKWILVK